jgi:glycine cleavage system H lipoate-binding protein
MINSHSQSQGWYAKLKIDESAVKDQVSKLLNEDAYNKYLQDLRK